MAPKYAVLYLLGFFFLIYLFWHCIISGDTGKEVVEYVQGDIWRCRPESPDSSWPENILYQVRSLIKEIFWTVVVWFDFLNFILYNRSQQIINLRVYIISLYHLPLLIFVQEHSSIWILRDWHGLQMGTWRCCGHQSPWTTGNHHQ